MRITCCLFILATVTSTVHADVVSVFPSRDNTLYESQTGALSNGVGEFVFSGRTLQNSLRRGVMFFKLDAVIPPGSTITGVSLTLNLTLSQGTPADFHLQRLTANWGEGTSNAGTPGGQGAPSTTNDATWIHTFFSTQFWATPGGDFSSTVSATTNVIGNVGPYTWSSAQMAADVQNWVNTPGSNFGWIIRGDETTSQVAARFGSRENTNPTLRPVLEVTFTPVPEPGTMLLTGLGLGGVWIVRRVKKNPRRIAGG